MTVIRPPIGSKTPCDMTFELCSSKNRTVIICVNVQASSGNLLKLLAMTHLGAAATEIHMNVECSRSGRSAVCRHDIVHSLCGPGVLYLTSDVSCSTESIHRCDVVVVGRPWPGSQCESGPALL